jgi:hypothetical protein
MTRRVWPLILVIGLATCGAARPAAAVAQDSTEARFAAMSPDEIRAYERETLRRIADLALIPPVMNTDPLPQYDYDRLDYGMTIGIERTPKGRLWACWVAGGDSPKAFFVLATSDDDGETWSKPRLVVDSHSPRLPRDRSILVGNLWTDPLGRLWLIFDQSMEMFDGRGGVWASICENPDAEEPAWSPPRRIWHGVTLNKPTVLSTGEWMLPISLDQRLGTHPSERGMFGPFQGLFPELDPLRGANVFVSTDKGATWQRRGGVAFPNPDWHEHMIVERRDTSLWMLARTAKGIMQSTSADGGRTWSEPTEPPGIRQPNARFHVRRLASGRLLLVKHGDRIDAHEGRVQLSAWLSDDDGATWQGGLVLDERAGISYPDGLQAPDGTISISYDRNRATDGEILLARFTEADVLAKRLVGPKSKLKMLISRPLAPRPAAHARPTAAAADAATILPAGWNPRAAADAVLARLVRISAPQVKGAHDAEFVCVGDRAYVVEHDNDIEPGHGAGKAMYCVLTVVNLETLAVEKTHLLAKAGQAFTNATLPDAEIFVPRIIRKDEHTLRCWFCSQPAQEQAVTWYRDFDLRTQSFAGSIHKARLKTAAGVFDMEPRHFHADAMARGFTKPPVRRGLYIFDSFKEFDGRRYVALNNFEGKQNALAVLLDDFATFEVIGHFNEPQVEQLSESAINRLPDGTWMAICRNDKGNYHFTTSRDGRTWTVGEPRPFVPNGLNSKPTFERFGGVYHLGWQENTKVGDCNRSVFNIDVSRDGKTWERKYRFESPHSFQYPTFHEHEGTIWLAVTQSDHKGSSDRIMFGRLEDVAAPGGRPKPPPTFAGPTPGTLRQISIPTVDISGDTARHAVVARGTPEAYQGHCDTVLMADGRTMFAAWCMNHAGHLGPLARSDDGGRTWSPPLPTPDDWRGVKTTTPVMHRLTDPQGVERLFVFGGCDFPGNLRRAVSEDGGRTWSPMQELGLVGEVAPKSILPFDGGKRLVMWSDRRDPKNASDPDPVVWQSESLDGGLTWRKERVILGVPGQWAQPCVVRSPDGRQLLMLMRENTRHHNSLYSVSDDGARTWSAPEELPAALTGDRHVMKYAPDGRLVVAMRDMAKTSPTYGHYVAWVGRYDDIVGRREGEYRIKLLHNAARTTADGPGQGNADCGYSDIELLPDGTLVATTYVKHHPGPEKHSVVSTRFTLAETDGLLSRK